MSEAKAIPALGTPNTLSSLQADLHRLGLKSGATVLVHSSLSALGWVCGGPMAVIQALEAVLGPAGTLMMPAHTSWNSEPCHWCNPPVPESWWPVIRAEMPGWQPDLAPTRGMGVIAETFRKQQGVLRSEHPQASFTARGPRASELLEAHALSPAFGEQSPLGRLCDLDGQVLLLGVGHDSNTSLHLAELRAGLAEQRKDGAAVMVQGQRRWISFEDFAYDESDFGLLGTAFRDECSHAVQQGLVGLSTCQLFHQRPLLEYAEAWFREHRQELKPFHRES